MSVELMNAYPLYSNDANPEQDGKSMVAISFQFGDDLTGQLNVKVDSDVRHLSDEEKITLAKAMVKSLAFKEE